MKINQAGNAIGAMAMVEGQGVQTLSQMERWLSPGHQVTSRDIKLVNLGTKPGYLKFVNKAVLNRRH